MATIVLRIADQFATDALAHATKELRGDVVEVVPDGWPFSAAELAHAAWRIVSLPAVSLDEARSFAAPGHVAPWEGRIAPARAFGLDLDGPPVPAGLAAFLADDSRSVPVFTSDLTAAQLGALRVARVPAPHPAVFGIDRRVFG